MLASELLGSKWLDEHKDIDITGIAYDSRNEIGRASCRERVFITV